MLTIGAEYLLWSPGIVMGTFKSRILFNPHKYSGIQIFKLSEPLTRPFLPTSSPKGLNKIWFSLLITVCGHFYKFYLMRQLNMFPDDCFSSFVLD